MFDHIYKGKTALITGHTGFKGSWLAIWLMELGADVIGYALDPPTVPNNFDASRLREKVTNIQGDIRNLDHLTETFNKYKPEFVFHLAAQSLVRLSYEEPKITFDTNIGGTVNVLEAVRSTPCVKVLLNVTSDKCYRNREWVWGYRENDPLGGDDPYSASKGCAEIAFNAYLKSFFAEKTTQNRNIGAASVRAGNVIGGGDWGRDRLVPDCIRALNRHKPIGIRNPKAVRPWQHVLDPLSGYLLLGAALLQDPLKYTGAWNFGPDETNHLTVEAMTEQLIKYWGEGSWEDLSSPNSLHEASILKLNCDKARFCLNWHSAINIKQSLQMTADWYKRFYMKRENDLYPCCVEQIHLYKEYRSGNGDSL